MNKTTTWIILAVAVVAAVCVTTEVLRYLGGATKEVALPEAALASLPTELGPWTSEETDADEELFVIRDAGEVLNRVYRDPAGRTVSLHAAFYTSYFRVVPHSPMVCYPANGFTLIAQKDVELENPGEPTAHVRMATFEKDGSRSYVLFWFQLGSETFWESHGLEDARRTLRGLSEWPTIVKVLLTTQANNPEQAEAKLVEFAKLLYGWTSQLQKTATASAEAPAQPAAESTPPAKSAADQPATDATPAESP